MKRILFALFFLIFISGCVHITPVIPMKDHLQSVNVGEKRTVFIGNAVVYVLDGKSLPGFIARSAYDNGTEQKRRRDQSLEPQFDIPMNSEWSIIGRTKDGESFCKNPYNQACLFISSGTFNNKFRASSWGECETGEVRKYDLTTTTEEIFEKTDRIFQFGYAFMRRELLYNGKSGATIKLSYRVYKNDLARPAYMQDLVYDLTESKIIGFQGMKIEVLNATNEKIEFILLSLLN